MVALPSLFISHGSPMLALEAGATGAAWRHAAAALSRPAAIVIASAHWETAVPMLGSVEYPETIHDFGGFPAALYRLQYPAPGAPAVARKAQNLLREAGFAADLDTARGLDHGAWVPLREMFADATVPTVQLSLQTALGPRHAFAIGRALAALAQENILLIGSGSITHNLRDGALAMRGDTQALSYVPEFQRWVYAALMRGDIDALFAYRTISPYGRRAHPTEEHFLPLFFALGAAGENPSIVRAYDSIAEGILGMDLYRFSPQRAA